MKDYVSGDGMVLSLTVYKSLCGARMVGWFHHTVSLRLSAALGKVYCFLGIASSKNIH